MSTKPNRMDADQALKARAICEILRQEFPACFKQNGQKAPIKCGIHRELLQHYKQDQRFTENELKLALSLYTHSMDYLQALVVQAPRLDLQGETVATVTPEEAEYAQRLLAVKQDRRAKQISPAYARPLTVPQTNKPKSASANKRKPILVPVE